MNKRLQRLNLAKHILKTHAGASADDVVGMVRAMERKKPDPFKSVGQLLERTKFGRG